MSDKPKPGAAIERCKNAVLVLGFTHPHFLLVHSKISENYIETTGTASNPVGTMAMTATGKFILNPEFVMKQDKDELAGVMAHEMLHLLLSHHERKGGRDHWTWNIATDMCINDALQRDNIKLPKSVVYPPKEYTGDLFAETVYEWLMKNPQHVPARPKGDPMPGAGCSPLDDPSAQTPDWRQTGIEARAMAQQAGKGTGAVASLLAPRQAKIDWKKVIRSGFQMACSRPGRDYQTFSSRHRRSPPTGAQLPGWKGMGPRIAVCIDVSGSMDRKWVERIVAEIKSLLKQFPGTKCYLNAHTSDVVYSAWVTDQTKGKIDAAVQFSGGTDPNPAYADIKQQGKFDCMIHFTDCEFYGDGWPAVPAKHLIVGAFTRDPHSKPPPGSTVIPCEIGREY